MTGLVSDIHGNYPALCAVLSELDAEGCSRVISLGDVCGYYCMVNECIAELSARGVINIMGNHDSYIVNGLKCGRSHTANRCLDFQREALTEKNLGWLRQSVPFIRENGMWMVHGGWNDYEDEYVEDFSFLDQGTGGVELYISGHTHIQRKIEGAQALYVNPGSVGQPRDHDPSAAYAVIQDNGEVQLKRACYDIDRIAYAMKAAGFEERVASCLYTGTRIGEDGK